MREGVNKHKCENTQSVNTHPQERRTQHWLESGPPVLLQTYFTHSVALRLPSLNQQQQNFLGWFRIAVTEQPPGSLLPCWSSLKHSYHVTTQPENSNFSAHRNHPSLTVLPSLDPFSQHASVSQIRPCTLLPPTCGLCAHAPWLLGVTLDKKTGGPPCSSPSDCALLLPKATFSMKLHSVSTHASQNLVQPLIL